MSEAHVVLVIDSDLAQIHSVNVWTSRSLKAIGEGLSTLPLLGFSANCESAELALAECRANLGSAAWLFGLPGTPLRDAVDRMVSGSRDGLVAR